MKAYGLLLSSTEGLVLLLLKAQITYLIKTYQDYINHSTTLSITECFVVTMEFNHIMTHIGL